MLTRLRELEAASGVLDPPAALRRDLLAEAGRYAERFLANIQAAEPYVSAEDAAARLQDEPIGEEPLPLAEVLAILDNCVDHVGVNLGAPGFLAFIPGGPLYHAALGDFLAAVSNRYAGVYFSGPGAVRIEKALVRWIASFTGYPATTAGDLTSGGSIANLSAVLAAREAHGLRARDVERAVVYSSSQVHHSLKKALRIAGLGEVQHRVLPLDDRFRLRPADLAGAIAADRVAGLHPWLILASAGTTDTGAVDPLADMADISAREGTWLHIDGAYGAAFSLCPPGRAALVGIDRGDSLVLDPHKGLFMPYGSGAVLVRDGRHLHAAFDYEAAYMRDTVASRDEVSPAELSPELSRHFRGLRLWLALKVLGVRPFRAALEEKLLLARLFHQRIGALLRFEAGPEPDLSIVVFRYVPAHGDANRFNQELARSVRENGRIFMSTTTLADQVVLRLAVLGFRTHLDTIELALDELAEHARRLEKEGY